MSIETALKFVIGAVARKDFVEGLCHVEIKNNVAVAYDGLLSMSTPIEIGLNVRPHARTFLKTIQTCKDDTAISLHVTPAGKLAVRAGNFRAFVECLPGEADMVQPKPEGDLIPVSPELLESIRALAPLMAIDASRPWARGLLLCGNSTFATNNIVLAEHWHGSGFPRECIIPADAITELLRTKETPTHVQVSERSASFHFAGDRWLRTQLVEGEWPHEHVTRLLDQGGNPTPLPQDFFTELQRLKPFVEEGAGVRISEQGFSTTDNDENGAKVEIDIPNGAGHFHIQQLLGLEGVATKVDFTQHPKPCYWQGGKMRGVILGRVD